jgi:hypothetical protein
MLREQLADNDVGTLKREMDARRCPKWRDVTDQGPIYKSYWAQWKSLAVRDGVLERHWESADRKKDRRDSNPPQQGEGCTDGDA